MTFGRQPHRVPLSAIFRCCQRLAIWPHLWSSTVSNAGRGRKPLINQGKDLRGLLKSIIRLRLIVIGAPAARLASERAASRNKALTNLPTTHVRMGLTTPLPRQSIWERCSAAWSWQPRGLCAVGSALGRLQQEGGADRPEDQPQPVLISVSVHSWDTTMLLRGPKLGHGNRQEPKRDSQGAVMAGNFCQQHVKYRESIPGPRGRDTGTKTVSPCGLVVLISKSLL
jgi:hypothetical protein